MGKDIVRMAQAIDFAARKHTHQRRKGEVAEPYFNHLAEVAFLVAEAVAGDDPNLVIAAYLHDTIEDQRVTHGELVGVFGQDVADLVQEVTDDKTLHKAERKRLQIEHAHHASPRAKVLKMADKVSNLRAILASPPANWGLDRKLEYFDWAAEVVASCRGTNFWLEARFDEAYARRAEVMNNLERAIEIAAKAHVGMTDKAGSPYILHPLRVMMKVEPIEAKIVAVLHDVVEDCRSLGYTFEFIESKGFSPAVMSGLRAVTKLDDEEGKHSDPDYEEKYLRFVKRAISDPIGRLVKIADLEDNCDLSRIANPSENDHNRIQRYQRALALINAVEQAVT